MGIKVTGTFIPTDPSDAYPILEDIYLKGGDRVLGTIAERNAITELRRKFGMKVTLNDAVDSADNVVWLLANSEIDPTKNDDIMDNANWINISQAASPLATYTPTGALDGVNVTFTLPTIPVGALLLFLNGGYLVEGVDFTLSGLTITLTDPPVTDPTPLLRAVY